MGASRGARTSVAPTAIAPSPGAARFGIASRRRREWARGWQTEGARVVRSPHLPWTAAASPRNPSSFPAGARNPRYAAAVRLGGGTVTGAGRSAVFGSGSRRAWLGGAGLALAVATLAFATALADAHSGLRTWWALRADLREAETRIARLRADVAALERTSGGLEADPFALERAIRERLELARPGETLVRLAPRELGSSRIP